MKSQGPYRNFTGTLDKLERWMPPWKLIACIVVACAMFFLIPLGLKAWRAIPESKCVTTYERLDSSGKLYCNNSRHKAIFYHNDTYSAAQCLCE